MQSDELRQRRKALGLSLRGTAHVTGLDPVQLHYLEKGLTPEQASRLSKLLSVDCSSLVCSGARRQDE